MKKLHIGDELLLIPKTFYNTDGADSNKNSKKPLPGKVIYIHPKGRFITAAFKIGGGTVKESFKKESFKIIKLEGNNLDSRKIRSSK